MLTFFQEFQSGKFVHVKKYFIHQVRVVREGKEVECVSSVLVSGDIIHLEPGDIIPADVRFWAVPAHG